MKSVHPITAPTSGARRRNTPQNTRGLIIILNKKGSLARPFSIFVDILLEE